MKKLFSVILAITLLASCLVMRTSAEETTTIVSLIGEAHAVIGTEYKLYLNVTEPAVDTIGGLSFDITYNTEMFTLSRVEIASDFAKANRVDEDSNLIKDSSGIISAALLDVNEDQSDNKWLTFVFDVADNAKTGVSSTFSFVDNTVKASDANGTTLITTNQSVVIGGSADSKITTYTPYNQINGASIRKDASGNIRFEAEIPSGINQEDIAEIGFLMLPTAFLNNGDLTLTDEYADSDTEKKYPLYTMANGKKISIGHTKASTEDGTIEDKLSENKFYCYLTNTTDYPLNMEFSARPYVKLTDGTIIYACNVIDDNDSIKSGTSSRSCMSIAKAIYELYKDTDYTFDSDVVTIIQSNTVWTEEEYKKVVTALAEYADTFQ